MDKADPRYATGDDSPSSGTSERNKQRHLKRNRGILKVIRHRLVLKLPRQPHSVTLNGLVKADRRIVSGVSWKETVISENDHQQENQ